MIKQKSRPMVEILEDRWVPANIWYDGSGNLYVDIKNADLTSTFNPNNANRVEIIVGAANSVTVELDDVTAAGTFGLGTYTVSGNLTVIVGNTNRTVSHATLPHQMTFAGNSLPGSVSWTVGNSSAQSDFATTGIGSVAGNFSVTMGNGTNDVRIASLANVSVAGSVYVNTNSGALDSVSTAGATGALTASGNVYIRNAQTVTTATAGASTTVQGNLWIEANPKVGAKTISLAPAGGGGAGTTVNGHLRIITGGGLATDAATIHMGGSIAGSAYINMGNNTNVLNFGVTNTPTNVLKDVVFTGGNTGNTLNFGVASTSLIAGNLVFRTGNAADVVNLGSAANLITILGKTVTGVTGNGNDSVTALNVNGGGARVYVVLGNGNDSFGTGAAGTFNVAQSIINGGLGVDSYTTTGPFIWTMPHRFLSFVNV